MDSVRIYLVAGAGDNHLGLLEALQHHGRLQTGHYWVVGLWSEIWDGQDPGRYTRGFLQEGPGPVINICLHSLSLFFKGPVVLAAFPHYLGLIMSPPVESASWSYHNFTRQVKSQMRTPPFNHLYTDPVLLARYWLFVYGMQL